MHCLAFSFPNFSLLLCALSEFLWITSFVRAGSSRGSPGLSGQSLIAPARAAGGTWAAQAPCWGWGQPKAGPWHGPFWGPGPSRPVAGELKTCSCGELKPSLAEAEAESPRHGALGCGKGPVKSCECCEGSDAFHSFTDPSFVLEMWNLPISTLSEVVVFREPTETGRQWCHPSQG